MLFLPFYGLSSTDLLSQKESNKENVIIPPPTYGVEGCVLVSPCLSISMSLHQCSNTGTV